MTEMDCGRKLYLVIKSQLTYNNNDLKSIINNVPPKQTYTLQPHYWPTLLTVKLCPLVKSGHNFWCH